MTKTINGITYEFTTDSISVIVNGVTVCSIFSDDLAYDFDLILKGEADPLKDNWDDGLGHRLVDVIGFGLASRK